MRRDNADGEFDRNNYVETSVAVRDWMPTTLPICLTLLTILLMPNLLGLLLAVIGVTYWLITHRRHRWCRILADHLQIPTMSTTDMLIAYALTVVCMILGGYDL